MPIGKPAVLQQLQQYVEDVRMSFFYLIEQDDAIGSAAHGLGQLSSFLIAHIPGWRSDKT